MNKTYYQAEEIFEAIQKAKRIMITSHTSPDMDNVGSVLAFYNVLKDLQKKEISILYSDRPGRNYSFLSGFEDIRHQEITQTDLRQFDLMIILDCATLQRTTQELETVVIPEQLTVVNIDHHQTNPKYGTINIVDDIGSTSELLFNLFSQWEVYISKEIAQCLLTGIYGDTGSFNFSNSITPHTFEVAKLLVEKGATPDPISLNFGRNIPLSVMKFWAAVINKIEIIKDKDLIYGMAVLSYEDIQKAGGPDQNEGTTDRFFGSITGTDFGVFAVEEEKGNIKGSFRARSQVDVSIVAQVLGGGGHKAAAGFKFELGDLTFQEGVQKIKKAIKQLAVKNV